MALFRLRVEGGAVRAIYDADRAANAILRQLKNREQPLKKIKQQQIERWTVNFDSQGGQYGAWAPLSPRWTIPERERLGYSGKPVLVREGSLRSHFVSLNRQGQVDAHAINWNLRNREGAYPLTHQFGRPNPLAPMPARVLWDLDEKDADTAKKILEEWIGKIIARYWAKG